jgi:DNA mismatch repair protein MutS
MQKNHILFPLPYLHGHVHKTRELKQDVVFLHEVGPGAADRSYGVAVAKLAGLPEKVIKRAEAVLLELEKNRNKTGYVEELPLFAAQAQGLQESDSVEPVDEVCVAIEGLNPDMLSPKDALDFLYQLKALSKRE